ncbi:hypothetical protein [Lysobacter enzymogenes]|uniref:hypothetical protein n=1 Tax=Lysobacter enzymogenes TaxID=69 RepID=UPI0033950B39
MTAKRGGARRFARIDTALALLQTLRTAAVEVRLADAAPPPRPYRRGSLAGLAALDRLHAEPAPPPPAAPHARPPRGLSPEPPAVPLSIRRAKARAASLLDALEVGETQDACDAEYDVSTSAIGNSVA